MIHLFPKIKNRMLLIAACYLALVGVYIALNRTSNILAILAIALVGLAIVMFSQLLNATNAHSQLLAKLYQQLDVHGFLKIYEPKLDLAAKNPNTHLMVRLHLSNAYCALGEFDKAASLLTDVNITQKKKEDELLSRFAIESNLSYFAQQNNDVKTAKKHMDRLLALKKELESLQTSKPEKKRMVFSTELNELCMRYLETGKTDIEALRTLVRNNAQQLHKITISLWIARAYLAENNRREAVKLLEQIVKLAPDLYPGQEAARMLAALPGGEEA